MTASASTELVEDLRPVGDRDEVSTLWAAMKLAVGNQLGVELGMMSANDAVELSVPAVDRHDDLVEREPPADGVRDPIVDIAVDAPDGSLVHPGHECLSHAWSGQHLRREAFGQTHEAVRVVCEPSASVPDSVAMADGIAGHLAGESDDLRWIVQFGSRFSCPGDDSDGGDPVRGERTEGKGVTAST